MPTVRGATHWQENVVRGILTNPMYYGDMLQQKTITMEQFPFKRKMNQGEADQYLIEGNHPAIISKEHAEAVKELMEYRAGLVKAGGEKCKNRYTLSGKIICKECGKHFRRQKVYIGKPYGTLIRL